ncbi:MAG: type I methionyl aminopeptidase [Clostridia bacterium]|nr:type I methionyl aminopeptidase [Clostridia bacterium]
MISIKNDVQLGKMRSAGHLLYDILQQIREEMAPGMTTWDLDHFAYDLMRRNKAVPCCLGYEGFPATLCISINDEVVHGIPSKHVTMEEGDIVSIDTVLSLDGWMADSAFTKGLGKIKPEDEELIRVTEECFFTGARMALDGNRIGDISSAVQQLAESHNYGVIRDLTGHGIGKDMHEDPAVPNFGMAGHGVRLRRGMTICIEPMIARGHWQVHQLRDGWTCVTNDHKPAAHYEHTIVVTQGLPELLTYPGFAWPEAVKGENNI